MRIHNLFFSSKSENQYSGLGRDEILNQFESRNWNQMENNERINLLREAGRTYAQEHGIKNPPFIVKEHGNRYGGYNEWGNTIGINLKACSNPYEALDTIAHEENHAYQAQCIREDKGYTAEERALLKAENGIAYRSDGMAYDRQSLEIDSNNAGLRYLLQEQERFQKDPAYAEYMSGRERYFDKIVSDYNENRELCDESERWQIAKAYERGELSENEKKLAESCIQERNNSIKAEAERHAEESKEALNTSLKESFVEEEEAEVSEEKIETLEEEEEVPEEEIEVLEEEVPEEEIEVLEEEVPEEEIEVLEEEVPEEEIEVLEEDGLEDGNYVESGNAEETDDGLMEEEASEMSESADGMEEDGYEATEESNLDIDSSDGLDMESSDDMDMESSDGLDYGSSESMDTGSSGSMDSGSSGSMDSGSSGGMDSGSSGGME